MTSNPNPPETREQAIRLFDRFIRSRPGFDAANYISDWRDTVGRAALASDVRRATRQRHDALAALELFARLPYDATALVDAMRHAYSGRLEFTTAGELYYCAGQYTPTEYRAAAAACLTAYNDAILSRLYDADAMRQLYQS